MASEGSKELVVYADEDSNANINHRKLGMAIAHVSAQTHDLAEYQVQLHASQQLQAQQQQLYTESRVQQALAESETRTEALAQMIRATRIDPAVLEQHVNSKLQSALSAANDTAQNQARAVAETHAAHHAQVNDAKLEDAFNQLRDQLHASLEQRMRELLAAHMDQVGGEIRLAIATQGQEMLSLVEKQMNAIQRHTATQVEYAKSCAEKKAKSIFRRHHAEEHAVHEEIKSSMLQVMAKCKKSAVDAAEHRVDELLQAFTSHQARVPIVVSRPAFGQAEARAALQATQSSGSTPVDPADVTLSTLSDKEMSLSVKCSEENEADHLVQEKETLELLQMLRPTKSLASPNPTIHPSLRDVRRSKQEKVAARALARSRGLTTGTNLLSLSKSATSKLQRAGPILTPTKKIQVAVKRRSDERKAIKKKRAEDVIKLAAMLGAQKVCGKAKAD